MGPNPQFPADLVTFTKKILNGKLHFLCSVKVKEISKERDSLPNKIKAKLSAIEFRNIQKAMFQERLKNYLAKSDIVTRRKTSVIIFLLLKAITKIEDSAEQNAKNITSNAKRIGQNNNRFLSTRLNKIAPTKMQLNVII